MSNATIVHQYEDLANHFAKQGESRQRDQCLALAADAALSAEMPQEAERLRKRLLLTNPNHMLRPYASMADAMDSEDVRDYLADLRKQWPPEMVEKLVQQRAPNPAVEAGIPAKKARPKPSRPGDKANDDPVTTGSYVMAIVIFAVGVMLAAGLLFLAVGWP